MARINVTIPYAIHNLHGPEKDVAKRRKAIRLFLNAVKGGYGGVNELNGADRAYFKDEAAKRGLDVHIFSALALVWAPAVIDMEKVVARRVMTGGYVGADGVATPRKGDDDRRVGPNRYCLYGQCTLVKHPFPHEIDITHLMARSFTKHKWRIALFRKSVQRLPDGITRNHGVMGGDVNTNDFKEFHLGPDVNERVVRTPSTFGRMKYDQIREWGSIHVLDVEDVNTPSDHDLVTAQVRITVPTSGVVVNPNPPPKPKPFMPKPGQGHINWRKYGAPVRHPWAKRTEKWKRRNKRLHLKIELWKRNYLRNR